MKKNWYPQAIEKMADGVQMASVIFASVVAASIGIIKRVEFYVPLVWLLVYVSGVSMAYLLRRHAAKKWR